MFLFRQDATAAQSFSLLAREAVKLASGEDLENEEEDKCSKNEEEDEFKCTRIWWV